MDAAGTANAPGTKNVPRRCLSAARRGAVCIVRERGRNVAFRGARAPPPRNHAAHAPLPENRLRIRHLCRHAGVKAWLLVRHGARAQATGGRLQPTKGLAAPTAGPRVADEPHSMCMHAIDWGACGVVPGRPAQAPPRARRPPSLCGTRPISTEAQTRNGCRDRPLLRPFEMADATP